MEEISPRTCQICQKLLEPESEEISPEYCVEVVITFMPIDPPLIPDFNIPCMNPSTIKILLCPDCAKKEFAQLSSAMQKVILRVSGRFIKKIKENFFLLEGKIRKCPMCKEGILKPFSENTLKCNLCTYGEEI